jgi:hypothetical protein
LSAIELIAAMAALVAVAVLIRLWGLGASRATAMATPTWSPAGQQNRQREDRRERGDRVPKAAQLIAAQANG